jgi:amidase
VLEGASTQGVLTRTVADTAAILDILQGYETGDPYWTPPPSRPFIDEIGLAPGRLRIGVTTSNPSGAPVSPECVAAVEEARQLLVDVGHQTDEAAPDWNRADILDLYRRFYATLFAYDRPAEPADLEPPNRELLHYATRISSMDYARASVELQLWSRRIVQFWNSYDILLCPTLATPPPLLGTTYPGDPIPRFGMHAYIPFTPVANITGQPAINLPLHWTSGGLPIGVQLTARPAGEAELLRIAAQLEEAQPWRDRRPPVWDVESVTVTP